MFQGDLFLFKEINQFAGRYFFLDSLGIFFASYFEFFLVSILFLFLLLNFKKYWKMFLYIAFSAFLARFVIVEFIRWIWPQNRPFVDNEVNLLINYNPLEPSFPSGHAAFYSAISFIVYLYNKKAGIFFLISSFLISLSRVFVGIHWLSDIIAGFVVGIFSAWLIFKISKRITKENS